MYDHCIEKNKSAKNPDNDLRHLINKHGGGKENNFSKVNKDKEDPFFDCKRLRKSYEIRDEKTRRSSKVINLEKKGNKQTIDTART
jgi:hypothetical protein